MDHGVLWRFLPKELRGDETDSRTKHFYAEVKSIKDNLRSYWIKETVQPLVIFWLTQDGSNWASQTDADVVDGKMRSKWWLAKIKEDMSVVIWFMAKFSHILNLRWIFCELDAPTPREQKLKREMRAWLKGKLVLVCDMVYRGLIDHDPLDPKDGGSFNEFGAVVCITALLIRVLLI